jgi:MFS family permease
MSRFGVRPTERAALMTDDGPKFLPAAPPPDDRIAAAPGVQAGAPSAPAAPARAAAHAVAPGAWTALVLLLFINMFNYIDRQVLAAVVSPIRKEFFPQGGDLADFWMGLLSTAFMVAFMTLSPLFGLLADRVSRWKLMALGVAVWSLASGASGLAPTFAILFWTRAAVGVGEAAYGPAAPAVLSDLFPERRRGFILSLFYVAIPVGSAAGYILGGVMDAAFGWRAAFYAVVAPGLVLAALCLLMREPRRGQADAPSAKPHAARWGDYLLMLRTPSYVLCVLGYTAATFAVGGVGYWMPRYIQDYRSAETDPKWANIVFGGVVVLAGLLATLAGGWAGDKLRGRVPGSYFLVSGVGMLLAVPFVLGILFVPFPWAWAFVFLVVFWLFFNTGPINTIPANVTPPAVRASAYALLILVIHLFGDAFSPPIIGLAAGQAHAWGAARPGGWWSDFLAARDGWDFSFCLVTGMVVLSAALWLWGVRYLDRDTRRAAALAAAPEPPPA